jgi:SAM-dependent methyltransferase
MTEADELSRVAAAYHERDAASPSPAYSWENPAYVLYMQRVERELLHVLRAAGVVLPVSRVLDLGCGSGYFLHRLVEYGVRSGTGIDLMPDRVEEARRRYPALDVQAGSATALPFVDSSFDLVTQFTCLSSVLDPDVRAAIGRETWRVLRPGGLMLSFDMAPAQPVKRAVAAGIRRFRLVPSTGVYTPVEPLSMQELLRIFPGQVVVRRVPTLDFDLTQRLAGRPWITAALTAVRPLRTHLLLAIRR